MGEATLFVAAGHGGTDRGNTSAGPIEAGELRRIVGGMRRWSQLAQMRAGLGGLVFLDDGLDLQGELRVLAGGKLTAADGDLAADIHLDYRAADPGGGALVLYDEAPYARTIAELFLERWCTATGIKSNGGHRSTAAAGAWRGWRDFGFTAAPWPGLIVELGSLNCERDMVVVRDPLYQALALTLLHDAWRQGRTP